MYESAFLAENPPLEPEPMDVQKDEGEDNKKVCKKIDKKPKKQKKTQKLSTKGIIAPPLLNVFSFI